MGVLRLLPVPPLALLALVGIARAQPLEEDLTVEEAEALAAEQAVELGPPRPPSRQWQQILAAPRIGDRMSSVAVDPGNTDHIFVGTEEGTIIRTRDGGITWQERPLSAFNVLARSVSTDPGLGLNRPSSFPDATMDVDSLVAPDPISRRARATAYDDDEYPGPDLPNDPFFAPPLLGAVLRPRYAETIGVERLAVCPGARYPLLVATTKEVYGSDDDGETFMRLFSGSNAAPFIVGGNLPQVTGVACSPVDPEDVVVATSRGVMRSTDGGLTFSNDVRGTSAGIATAIAWDEAGAEVSDSVALLVAIGVLLFAGDPDSEGGLAYVYPDWNNMAMAPYLGINWITTTRSAQIWLGTQEGIRASLDGGLTWTRPGGALFAMQNVTRISAGPGNGGRERIVALIGPGILPSPVGSLVYSSEDSGTTWDPFFIGGSRRTIRSVVSAGLGPDGDGVWLVLTTGELWRTNLDEPPPEFDARPFRDWARRKLRRTPPLADVLDVGLSTMELTPATIDGFFAGALNRAWVPIVTVEGGWASDAEGAFGLWTGSRILETDRSESVPGWAVYGSLTWSLPDWWWPNAISWMRPEMIQLQQEIAFVLEDAWMERRLHLERLAREAVVDELQARILRERVEALEAVLETWLRRPLESI